MGVFQKYLQIYFFVSYSKKMPEIMLYCSLSKFHQFPLSVYSYKLLVLGNLHL